MNNFVYLSKKNIIEITPKQQRLFFVTVLFGAYGTQYVNNFYHYKNNGSFSNPVYELESSNFLETLDFYSDACPELADIDNDGDLDFFIGTEIDYSTFPFRGRIKYFKNIGNIEQPFFDLMDHIFLVQILEQIYDLI